MISTGQLVAIISIFGTVWAGSMFFVNNTVKHELHVLGDTLRADIKQEVAKYQNVYTVDEILAMVKEAQNKDIQDITKLIKDVKRDNRIQNQYLKNYLETERRKYDTLYYKTPMGRYYRVIHELNADSIHSIETIDKVP